MEEQLDGNSQSYNQKISIRDRLSHFTWSWFECTMSTGAMATLLSQQPFSFHGLRTIGKIFFILDLVLFTIFSFLILFRFTMTSSSLRRSLYHPHESFFFGTFWVSIALILYCIQQYGTPSVGPWLVKALEICFWVYAACALLVAIFQYHVIFDEEDLPVVDAMPAWILPGKSKNNIARIVADIKLVYPFLVLGPLASVLEYSQPRSSALPILIGGITFQGLGWMFAFFIYTIYLTRLINSDLPLEPMRPGMYVAVGPAAYTSNTLVVLGMQAPKVLPANFLGITSVPIGDLWKAIGVPCGIFLWLLGFWFSALSTVSVLAGIRKMHFTMNWWAFIFPNAGLTIAAIQIGNVLGSNGIKGVTSAMTILLVIMWIYVAVMNIRAVWKKQVLWPGMDEDMEDIEGHQHFD